MFIRINTSCWLIHAGIIGDWGLFACQLRVDPYSASSLQVTAALASLENRSVRYYWTCFMSRLSQRSFVIACINRFIAIALAQRLNLLYRFRSWQGPPLEIDGGCACCGLQIVVQASVSQNFTGPLLQTTGSTLIPTRLPNLTASLPYYLRVGVVPPIPAPVTSLAYNIASLLPPLATSWASYSAGNGSSCMSAAVCSNCPMPAQPAPVTVTSQMPLIGTLLGACFLRLF